LRSAAAELKRAGIRSSSRRSSRDIPGFFPSCRRGRIARRSHPITYSSNTTFTTRRSWKAT
jgi:hypothetical protein